MDNRTVQLLNRYIQGVAQRNGVSDATRNFNVAPQVEQRLERAIRERSNFLSMINIKPVKQIKGETLRLGPSARIASRKNTSTGNPRNPRDMAALTAHEYECSKTNFDTAMPYGRLDTWAHEPEFERLLSDEIIAQIAEDRLVIGWHGTSRADNSDPVANPMLEDVNIGWLQKWRNENPERVMTGAGTPGRIQIGGTNADYQNLDALVFQAATLLHPALSQDPGLTCIVGRGMLHEKYYPKVDQPHAPTEEVALNVILATKLIGGYRAMVVPYFPEGTLLLTNPKNLSIYYQTGSRRRRIVEEPHLDRWADYQSVNEDYVVELYEGGVVMENVVFGDQDQGGEVT